MRCADGRWVYARRFVLFCTRFVYLISCRDPRPPRQRPSRPNTKRPTVRCSKTLLCAYVFFCSQQPAASSQQQQASNGCRAPRPQRQRLSRPNAQRSNVRRPWLPHSRRHWRDGTTHDATKHSIYLSLSSVEYAAHPSVQPAPTAPTARNPKVNHERVVMCIIVSSSSY